MYCWRLRGGSIEPVEPPLATGLQWDEAKSGRQNLWAAQMSVQLQKAAQYYY